MKDCCMTADGAWFRYRVGAVIVADGCALFARTERGGYYYSVGGGVHIGERSDEAVVREVLGGGIPEGFERYVNDGR